MLRNHNFNFFQKKKQKKTKLFPHHVCESVAMT